MCDNQVSYFIASGYAHKEVFVKCGNTDPYGGRALCDACARDATASAEHRRILADSEADNAWAASAGHGEY